MSRSLRDMKLKMDSLSIFSNIKRDPVMEDLGTLLDSVTSGDTGAEIRAYSALVSDLYPQTADLSEYIRDLVLQDENFYIRMKAEGAEVPPQIEEAAAAELSTLEEISALTSGHVKKEMGYDGFLPSWTTGITDLKGAFAEKLANIRNTGYGIFAKHTFFRLDSGRIVPVTHPDYQPLEELFGYEREQELIIKNTEALIDGTGASNMLLYGDAGTGKSSTIKAVAAAYAGRGLRILEVRKNQLYQIPDIMEELASNPLRFILFIDDLSFSGNDDNFSALKATLEGSISGCSSNMAIYATSNRRHLIRESFEDREGSELHLNDTLQETMSLAARFGLAITFQKPEPEEYLDIVKSLAEKNGIDMEEAELFRRAEAHAIRKNGRSPRTAKQFIELLKIGIN